MCVYDYMEWDELQKLEIVLVVYMKNTWNTCAYERNSGRED